MEKVKWEKKMNKKEQAEYIENFVKKMPKHYTIGDIAVADRKLKKIQKKVREWLDEPGYGQRYRSSLFIDIYERFKPAGLANVPCPEHGFGDESSSLKTFWMEARPDILAFLRGLEETSDWSDSDLEYHWSVLVENAIKK